MPPKFVNQKAAAANERKAAAAAGKAAEAARLAEEEKWKITDPKELKMLEKKAKSGGSGVPMKAAPKKLTQAEIMARLVQAKKDLAEQEKRELDFAEQLHVLEDHELPVNLNHIARDEAARAAEEGQEYVDASGIDAALGAMSIGGAGADKHPEKRMRAAYAAYEEEWMERLKGEGLKRSQLKEKIFKQWQKAPENPMNQK